MDITAAQLFKELTLKDADAALSTELNRLVETIQPAEVEKRNVFRRQMDDFHKLFKRYLDYTSDLFEWSKIEPLPKDFVKYYTSLETQLEKDCATQQLNKLVVVKLNGGLGTTMGCTGPKSLISVRNDLTFLDLNVQQIEGLNNIYGTNIPLVLMNSFNTNRDTEKVLRKYQQVNVEISTFKQSMYPRLNRESLLPLAKQAFDEDKKEDGDNASIIDKEVWYPPGHGDFYRSFVNSGLAEKFLAEGKEWVFLSNIDNLGATVDLNILHFLLTSTPKPEFVMEVTDKTSADVKGGTLTYYQGHLRLLELAQVPKDHKDEFASVRTFRIFNTNNLWINLKEMTRLVRTDKVQMEIIVNPKTLDSGLNVLQLEQAAGAAIKSFNQALGINVPRSRFLPVKTTSDLLMVMSNLYELQAGHLILSPLRSFPSVPLVKLGSHFKKVKDFLSRFASIPNMLELDHLTVAGDVYFGKDIVLKGTVIIIANVGNLISLPSGSTLENKIVSGNLSILDH
ncbi:UTP--glucose-1-phosphate uridylyltransferase [Paragonimus heterotremus]|uniref:UTP--glucose-1-phosphate uridylyltransferase n=1 Tax=Paragonimus heterotremus TaxID=100268 RepID=A0A8J4TKQ9_9TREM|nr:UTP--glucose-1-phosphate uridylyltransferase [Paragonimus heterotremus]